MNNENIIQSNTPPSTPAEPGEGKKDELRKCEQERDEYLAGWQRAKADFLNYKKDELTRIEAMSRYRLAEIIDELIVVIDNFDLGLAVLEKKAAGPTVDEGSRLESRPGGGGVDKGIYMIRAQIWDILKKQGAERLTAQVGEPLDPTTTEAVAEIHSELPAGTVLEEIEPGYRWHDKIIRPVRVKVSKGRES